MQNGDVAAIRLEGAGQALYANVREILEVARKNAYRAVNFEMVKAYWEVGKSIVEAQGGEERAEYGNGLIKELSKQLTKDFGKGFDRSNLMHMRNFYLSFPIVDALRRQLSWTHYRMLLKVKNSAAREWYMNECVESNWSTRQLEHQINSFYFERTLASKPEFREELAKEVLEKEPSAKPEDLIKDPYVLDFLGLEGGERLRESDLESALIAHLQEFLLELGRGFAFVARQKRLDFDDEHFYVDLVFYNYILKCFVLIDLKTGKLTHQDIGQMDGYVRMYDDLARGDGDNPTVGIVLCSEKNEAVARYSVLADKAQLFASKYELTLPSAEELEGQIEQERKRFEEERKLDGEGFLDGENFLAFERMLE